MNLHSEQAPSNTQAMGAGKGAAETTAATEPVRRPAPLPSKEWRVAPGDPTCVFTGDIATPIKFFSKERAAMVVAAVNAYRSAPEPCALPTDRLNDWDLENVRKEMESRGWRPDHKGEPDCFDQASAMAEAAIRELQARRAAQPPPDDEPVKQPDTIQEIYAHARAITKLTEVWPADGASQPPVPEWQPIETAPKNGTDLLLAKIVGHIDHPTAVWWIVKGSWSLKWNKWWDGIEPCGLSGPSHWMPIPRAIAPTKSRCGACSPAEFGGPLCACHTSTKEPELAKGCHRSHPHEDMNSECERLTAIARARAATKEANDA